MTMQVAYVGTDGILVASDKRAIISRNEMPDVAGRVSKVLIDAKKGMLVASAQSDHSLLIGRKILAELRLENLQFPPVVPIEQIAEHYLANLSGGFRRQDVNADVLVVLTCDLSRIYHLVIQSGEKIICWVFEDKTVAGHSTNSAVFFSERYYRKVALEELNFLAAHVITAAKRLNDRGISGLEIWHCKDDGFHRVDAAIEAALTDRSVELDDGIDGAIFGAVDKDKFDAVLRALINSKPLPFSEAVAKPKPRKDGGFKRSAKKSRR